MVKNVLSGAVLAGVLVGPVVAQPITLDFSAYPAGTALTSVNIPGVTFIPSPGVDATVASANTIYISDPVAGADLRIKLSRQALSGSFSTDGGGNCQIPGMDALEWRSSGAVVASGTTYQAPNGRCFNRSFTQTAAHDELVFDVQAGAINSLFVSNIQFNLVPAPVVSPTPVPGSSHFTLALMAVVLAAAGWLRIARRRQT